MSILEVLSSSGRGLRSLLLIPRLLRDRTKEALDRWSVQYESVDQPAGSLSGGNVQRLILARELSPGVKLLVAAQPTQGLDFAATRFVRDTLRDHRASRGGVLLVSSDLDELLELSDRITVFLGGRIRGEFQAPYDVRAIGDAMTGAVR